ncbi:hypothetical protein L226DRAFT_569146 [Lentinus tigrinus ALCF2SS1-7]|uniref:uncharacterized protein n=1 Tax=Lentinus tigrinus ALCF2SS1-7 TaxID=1328758 RepID=UPI001165F338|nr:hypothetical protein L226DRAFT_569146 [Lentinus tigrinus ALCF2SS1-7]
MESIYPLFDLILSLSTPSRWHYSNFATQTRLEYIDNFVKMSITGYSIVHAEIAVVRVLLARNGGVTFLPSLLCFEWLQTREAPHFPSALLPSTLREFVCNLEPVVGTLAHDGRVQETLTRVARSVPHLQSLYVKHSPPVGCALISRPLSSFLSLEDFQVQVKQAISPENLKTSAFLPHLRTLQCVIDAFTDTTDRFFMPSLRYARIGGSVPSFTGFIAGLHAPLLSHLDFVAKDTYSPCAVTHFISTVWDSSIGGYLQSLHFDTDELAIAGMLDMDHPVIPLVSLPDTDFVKMAQAWPHLEELALVLRWESSAFPSLAALVHLSQYCPELERCMLPLDINTLPEPPAELPDPAPSTAKSGEAGKGPARTAHPLRTISFRLRQWRRAEVPPAALARILHALFPGLDVLECSEDQYPKFRQMRGDLEKMWFEFQALQERESTND